MQQSLVDESQEFVLEDRPEMSNSTRRNFLGAASLGVLGFALSKALAAYARSVAGLREMLVYVGTYTSGKSEGIYLYRMNLSSGELKHAATTTGVVNPSFLAVDPRRRNLYAVNEVTEVAGRPGGAVSAFSIDQRTGELRFLNQQPSLGGAPCYVTVDQNGKFVLVANYAGGNLSVLPIEGEGRLGAPTDMRQHHGSGLGPKRQEAPHAHCIVLDRANRYACACDLGTDKVMIYRFDARNGKLTANQQPWVEAGAGAGPRHITFHPGGSFAYVINELDSTVSTFAYDGAKGRLKNIQTVPTLPKDFSGVNTTADIHVSPNGRFLYGSNRGHDSIVVFAIDETTGKLSLIGHTLTEGKTPRNFAIDPAGAFLLAANQDSGTIITFRLDTATGKLSPTGQVTEVPSPVCLKLIPPFS
jgi:6-phosphogluconolactonase